MLYARKNKIVLAVLIVTIALSAFLLVSKSISDPQVYEFTSGEIDFFTHDSRKLTKTELAHLSQVLSGQRETVYIGEREESLGVDAYLHLTTTDGTNLTVGLSRTKFVIDRRTDFLNRLLRREQWVRIDMTKLFNP